MKAAIFKGKGNIAVEERPKPTINEPTDAVVRVVLACVCGSDLWYYRGESDHHGGRSATSSSASSTRSAPTSRTVAVGDFVISPFACSDGVCKNCEAGFHTACIHGGFFGGGGEGRRRPSRVRPGSAGRWHPRRGSRHGLLRRDAWPRCSHYRRHEHRLPRCGQRRRPARVTPSPSSATARSGCPASCRRKMLGAERIIVLGSTHEIRHQLAREWGATDIISVRGDEAIKAVTT